MPTITMKPTLGDVLKHEYDRAYCREAGTLKAGTNYAVGTVLARDADDGKLVVCVNDTAADGSHTPVGILLADVDATDGDKTGVYLARGPAMLSANQIVWGDTINDAAKKAAKLAILASLGIVARTTA